MILLPANCLCSPCEERTSVLILRMPETQMAHRVISISRQPTQGHLPLHPHQSSICHHQGCSWEPYSTHPGTGSCSLSELHLSGLGSALRSASTWRTYPVLFTLSNITFISLLSISLWFFPRFFHNHRQCPSFPLIAVPLSQWGSPLLLFVYINDNEDPERTSLFLFSLLFGIVFLFLTFRCSHC